MRIADTFAAAACAAALVVCAGPAAAALVAKASPAPSASPDATPTYDKFVTGAKVQDGIFPVVTKSGKVYLTLAKDQLDRDFYEHATTANGLGGFGLLSGDDFDQPARIVRFEKIDDKRVAFVYPQERFDARAGSAVANAVAASTANSVQAVAPIVAEDKDSGKVVVDAAFLLGDQLDIGNRLSDIVDDPDHPNSQGSYHLDSTRTYFGASKAFPKNVIIEADQTFASSKPDTIDTVTDPRSIQMRVKYNFAQILSSPDYMPRLADDRVGYWIDEQLDFNSDDRFDNGNRYVVRWNMKASDPSRASPAVKPIVYTLTNTIPHEYRGPIRDAILAWNHAFERIGIQNAVQVQDQPNDPNWDPDDVRYNTIRWLTEANGGGFLEAQIEWDPRSGEIFRGGVLIDSDFVRYSKFEYKDVVAPDAIAASENGGGDLLAQIAPELYGSQSTRPHRRTTFLHRDTGMRAQAALGALALELYGEPIPPAYTYAMVKAVVMHEVGHDFGLAHNFIGHDAFTAGELRSKPFTDANGVASSVMEYAPLNLWPKNSPHGDYFQQVLGPYDYHVIHWGYAPIAGAKTPQDEVPTLDRWAQAAVLPKYRFASDEDVEFNGHAVDPRVAQFMLTNDQIGWCDTQLGIDRSLLRSLDSRFPRAQMPWDQERSAFGLLIGMYGRCSTAMSHYVAGEYLSRARRGDPHAPDPLTPVARGEELRAFRNLDRYVFSADAFPVSSTTLRRIVYSEYEPIDNYGYQELPRHDISFSGLVGNYQNRALNYMFGPLVLQRLADLPAKAAGRYRTMTLADLFTWTQRSVYGDLHAGTARPSELRRNLQRYYAHHLERIAIAPLLGTPPDAQALARHELVSLAADLRRDLRTPSHDLQTQAHLEALQDEVARTLSARATVPVVPARP